MDISIEAKRAMTRREIFETLAPVWPLDYEDLEQWFSTPLPALDGKTPDQMIADGRDDIVVALIDEMKGLQLL